MNTNSLEIALITFNRSYFLKRTLQQLFSTKSPVRNFIITIIDNNSCDDTEKICRTFQKQFHNLRYLKNSHNVGGNANACKAYELLSNSLSKYIWVICDDDFYEWDNWNEVEDLMKENIDCIGVANYANNNKQIVKNEIKLFQLSFIPAGIYKTSLLKDDIITNMYDSIFTMFPQLCLPIHIFNNKGVVQFVKKSIVYNGIDFKENKSVDNSYFRNSINFTEYAPRKDSSWILGFVTIMEMLANKELARRAVDFAIPYKDIYGSFDNFSNCMRLNYSKLNKINYLIEIIRYCPNSIKKDFFNDFKDSLNEYKNILSLKDDEKNIYNCGDNLDNAIYFSKYKWYEKIFSIKNTTDKKYKILRIFGFMFFILN